MSATPTRTRGTDGSSNVYRIPLGLAAALTLAVTVTAQREFDELKKRALPLDSSDSRAVAIGDLDGDLDLDVVVANYEQQNVVLLNDGTGLYVDVTAACFPADSDRSLAVVLGDVDGDGDLDAAIGNDGQRGNPERNRLLLNDGNACFSDVTSTHLPRTVARTSALAFVDVDGDGDLDLVLGNEFADKQLFLNDGTGLFVDATAGRFPRDLRQTKAVASGDIDGDGDADLVFGNAKLGETNLIFRNDGTGTFSREFLSLVDDRTSSIALVDIDGDSDLDVAVGNLGAQNRLYLNDGTGRFADVSTTNLPIRDNWTQGVAFGDVDGDGDLDLLWADSDENQLHLNDGNGSFTEATAAHLPPSGSFNQSVVLGDVDGDGAVDALFGNRQYNELLVNDGRGTFVDVTASGFPTDRDGTFAVALGDIDGDGDLDLVAGNGERDALYRNNGRGTITASVLPAGGRTFAAAFSDVDADRDLDLVMAAADRDRLYLNDGTGTFVDVTATRMPSSFGVGLALALGDVDDDQDVDIVIGVNRGPNRLYLNDGSGFFTDVSATHLPTDSDRTDAIELGDVDGDRDLDLVIGNDEEQNRLYLNDGSGRFRDVTPQRMPLDTDPSRCIQLGDIDGDGDIDAIIGNLRRQDRIYTNDGTGTFSDATTGRLPARQDPTYALLLQDLDEDGDLDLLAGNSGANGYYLNDGRGHFTAVAQQRLPPDVDATYAMAAGDLDGDGDIDVITGNGSGNRRYWNLRRQLGAPLPLRSGLRYEFDAYVRYGDPSWVDVAFPFMSPTTAAIPLPPLGTVGIEPGDAIALPPVIVPRGLGVGSIHLNAPNNASFVGTSVHAQAVLLREPFLPRLTNTVTDVFIR